MFRTIGRSLATFAGHAIDVGRALFGIQERDDDAAVAARVGGFAARRVAYLVADYWLMGLTAAFVLGMKALEYPFAWIFLATWLFDTVIATAFVFAWRKTGIDITLGEDFRRAADVIHARSRFLGLAAFALVLVRATVWSGPEHIVIFFHKELSAPLSMALVLLSLAAIQAAIWSGIYSLGFDTAADLITLMFQESTN